MNSGAVFFLHVPSKYRYEVRGTRNEVRYEPRSRISSPRLIYRNDAVLPGREYPLPCAPRGADHPQGILVACWCCWLVPTLTGSRYSSRSAFGQWSHLRRCSDVAACGPDSCHPTHPRGRFRTSRKGRTPAPKVLRTSRTRDEAEDMLRFSNTCLCGAPVSAYHPHKLLLPILPPPPAPRAAADHVRCTPPPGFLGTRRPRRRLLHVLRRELGEVLASAFENLVCWSRTTNYRRGTCFTL